jgi:hypothetical protein
MMWHMKKALALLVLTVLCRGLQGDQSKADILVLLPQAWSLHREEPCGTWRKERSHH